MQKQNWSVCVYGFMWVRGGEGEDPWLVRDVGGALLTVRARTGGDVQEPSQWQRLR